MQLSHSAPCATIERYQDVTGIILAGGRSRRMGRDKATLELFGTTLFNRIVSLMQDLFARVLIAGDRPDLERPGITSFPDIYPGSALGGIHGGLTAAETPWSFIVPCDLAYPDPELVRFMLQYRDDCDIVLPRTPEGLEPVFALYHKNCLMPIEAMLQRGDLRIFDFYDQVRVRYLDADILPAGWQQALLNLNNPDDLRRIKKESL